MTVGDLDHVYYWTRDMDAAVAFYRDVVGLEPVRRDGDAWAQFDSGPVQFALHGTDDEAAAPSGTVVFRVEDHVHGRTGPAFDHAPRTSDQLAERPVAD